VVVADDVAPATCYLAGDAAGYTTGDSTTSTAGGRSAASAAHSRFRVSVPRVLATE